MIEKKFLKYTTATLLLALPLSVFAQIDPSFNPSKLIDDAVFADTETFGGAAGIQRFLELKNSVLANVSLDFLVKLKEPQSAQLKTALEDPSPSLGRLRTAAELIWDSSRQSGLNPQVIIVTLNKEQGLITASDKLSGQSLQKALDRAMGFDCPDSTGCGDLFPGFYFQLFGNLDAAQNRYLGAAKSLMKSFGYAQGRGPLVNDLGVVDSDGASLGKKISKVGDLITVPNVQGPPYNAPKDQQVVLQNRATAALYRYTPYVYNGNYNFWRYFQAWFKYPNGTIFSLLNDTKIYIIQNGSRMQLPGFVAKARSLDLSKKIVLSPTELSSYPEDKVFGPADNTIVKTAEGKIFVFLNNTKHPASEFVIKQRGLKIAAALDISQEESALFEAGSVLPPADGTVLRGKTQAPIYLADGGKIKLFSGFVYKQNKSPKPFLVPDEELLTYERGGFVPPKEGTLIRSPASREVYLVETGLKRPITAELFRNRGFRFGQIAAISADEVNALPLGGFITPKERTFFAIDGKAGPLYIFKDGSKHGISKFVAKQRGITPDFVFSLNEASAWQDGIPIPPKDGSVIKGAADPTIYLVVNSQLRPLTFQAFKKRRITAKRIIVIPQSEVDEYAKGDTLAK